MSSKEVNIPVDSQIRDFKAYLDSNERGVLSARFGDGKSWFLNKFIRKYQNQYLFIPIYPVNYQVAENKDIFEYIKRDILIRLLSSGEIGIDETIISNSLQLSFFLEEQGIKSSLDLIGLMPDINLNGTDISLSAIAMVSKALIKIKELFKTEKSKYKNDNQIAENVIEKTITKKGSIYEFDVVSQLICDLIDQYRNKFKRRKIVLLIEDLDRVDPAHIFRILNIFSAHFDRYDISGQVSKTKGKYYLNKFKFDKIIMVCHYDNIKSIYHHCYGDKTDFNGYIDKFSTAKPFYYSLEPKLRKYILQQIHPDLQKYPKTCDALASMIISKYKDEENGIWGNLHYIIQRLIQSEIIRKEYITIDQDWKICSVNSLTRLLDFLNRFDLKWDELFNFNNGYAKEEHNDIINECWLYAKFGDPKLKFHKKDLNKISIGYEGYGTSFSVEVQIKDSIIEKIPINRILTNSYSQEATNSMSYQKDFILRHFNSYINNPNRDIL